MTELAPADPRLAGLPHLGGDDALLVVASDWAAARGLVAGIARVTCLALAADRAFADAAASPAAPWPLPEGAVDVVLLAGALRLTADPTALLDAAMARLRPGGLFLIAETMRAAASPAATRHLDALDLGAAIARARGQGASPVFQRLQVGSLIQGYDLVDLGFSPALPADDEAPEACREAAEAWRERFAQAAADEALPAPLRAQAAAFGAGGLALAPAMRVWGRKPA